MVTSSFRRPFAASLLAVATVVAAMLPPVHIHLAEHDDHDDDHAAVEHSHWSSHGASRAALDDDDGRAILVDQSAIASSMDTTLARPATAVIAVLILPAPAPFTAVDRPTSGNSPRDGPSRGIRLLRAPPSFATL